MRAIETRAGGKHLSRERGAELPRPEGFRGALHDFRLDHSSRRMICSKCTGRMNEVGVVCAGKPIPPTLF